MRIALVDDDCDSREVLAVMLCNVGYEVVEFADGADALDGLRRGPAPHLIVLDLRMPTMDGWQFRVSQKREPQLANTPVIALSADRSSQARAIDADAFLEKPTHYDKVIETVAAVLERSAARQRRENQLALEGMAVVAQFSAGVAHEINNPLSAVGTNLHLMGEDLARLMEIAAKPAGEDLSASAARLREGLGELAAMVGESLEAVHRIRAIVKDLQLLARADEQGAHALAIEPAIDAAINVAHHLALGHPTVVRKYEAGSSVMSSEKQLMHLFINFLANAFQAMVPGRAGVVTVETGVREDKVIVKISDNGVGIAPEARARIFEPFFTTRPVGQGKGLGLSVCHGLVASLGGSIDVISEVGAGSTFVISLPAAEATRGGVEGLT